MINDDSDHGVDKVDGDNDGWHNNNGDGGSNTADVNNGDESNTNDGGDGSDGWQ